MGIQHVGHSEAKQSTHQKAFTTVKEYLAKAPVLKYYDVNEEVTIQCDASETGLGAVLMQKGQPIAFASRALTDTETRYAQIEKELLAIVWSTDKFNQYILGREVVHIESDHETTKGSFYQANTQVTKETTENADGPSELLSGCAVQKRGTYVDIRCTESSILQHNRSLQARYKSDLCSCRD